MENSEATLASFDCTKIELPSGRVVELRVLTLSQALRFMRLLGEARATGGEALYILLEEFPPAVELDPEERLTPAEVIDLVECFFAHRRTPPKVIQPATPTTPHTGSTT